MMFLNQVFGSTDIRPRNANTIRAKLPKLNIGGARSKVAL